MPLSFPPPSPPTLLPIIQQVCSVIIGTRLGLSDNSDDNMKVFTFALDEADMAFLDDLSASLGSLKADCGDEYRGIKI